MAELSFKQRRAAALGTGDYKLRRRADPAMPTVDEMVVALWEHVVEGQPIDKTAIPALQARRLPVKARHPKNG